MADLGMVFVPADVDPGEDFAPIPPGDYVAEIVESETKPPKSGDGMQLVLKVKIIEGPYENRTLYDRLGYQQKNPEWQMMAQQRLRRICDAVRHEGPCSDSEQLHFIPMTITVGFQKDKATKQPTSYNEIKRYKPLDQQAAATPVPSVPPARTKPVATAAGAPRQQASAPSGSRPWGSRA